MESENEQVVPQVEPSTEGENPTTAAAPAVESTEGAQPEATDPASGSAAPEVDEDVAAQA